MGVDEAKRVLAEYGAQLDKFGQIAPPPGGREMIALFVAVRVLLADRARDGR